MTTDHDPLEDSDLAAEFALGLLTGDDLVRAQRRVAQDPDFAQEVTAWEIRLAALADDIAPQAPRPETRDALMARLFPASAPAESVGWLRRLWLWQAVSAASLVLLAAIVLFGPPAETDAAGPLYAAEIVADAGAFRVIAVVDKQSNAITVTRTAGAAPDGRILQVWAHGEGAPAVSVGLWPEGDTVRLPMPPEIAVVEGVLTIGISEEPPGGSPTGSPTGRVFGTVDIPGVTGT